MKRYTINLGLENNPVKADDLRTIIKATLRGVMRVRIEQSEYNGNPERTLVIRGLTRASLYEFRTLIDRLNTMCTQECIAYRFEEYAKLQFNDTYKGPRYKFNPAFFISA